MACTLACAWLIAQALALPLAAATTTAAALGAAATATTTPTPRLRIALGAILLPQLAGLLLLLGPYRSGISALVVQAAMVTTAAPLAPLLYAWTFSGRRPSRQP